MTVKSDTPSLNLKIYIISVHSNLLMDFEFLLFSKAPEQF